MHQKYWTTSKRVRLVLGFLNHLHAKYDAYLMGFQTVKWNRPMIFDNNTKQGEKQKIHLQKFAHRQVTGQKKSKFYAYPIRKVLNLKRKKSLKNFI